MRLPARPREIPHAEWLKRQLRARLRLQGDHRIRLNDPLRVEIELLPGVQSDRQDYAIA